METLYDSPPLSIFYDDGHEWLYVEWKGAHSAASAQSGGELILHHLQLHPCRKMLNDNSQVTTGWEEGSRWVGSHYYKTLSEQGIRFVAWVCPPNWSARKSMDTAMQFVTQPMVVLFDDLATAYAWLLRQS
ncbi:STAS/SEC14 domain-containing protein [Hymenobacter sp. DG01]|uniref:STAS/SEC14 domain-containing protein n=1 Tax=Hymenobacter sp. DG01 TaxID=2584940 RepID=UPI00112137C0|nr:STAS/SEC14 domain-containing protein [Hymenobacter sp. DG01]